MSEPCPARICSGLTVVPAHGGEEVEDALTLSFGVELETTQGSRLKRRLRKRTKREDTTCRSIIFTSHARPLSGKGREQ
ncbi:MAG: hypothetical protein RL685_906 [Pseudomonadota bacterium]|jgi:hypothetical protein